MEYRDEVIDEIMDDLDWEDAATWFSLEDKVRDLIKEKLYAESDDALKRSLLRLKNVDYDDFCKELEEAGA